MRLLGALLLILFAGCSSGLRETRVNIDDLDAVRQERVEWNLRARLAITVAANGEEAVLRERVLALSERHELRLVEDYPLPPLQLHVFVVETSEPHKLDELIALIRREPGVRAVQRVNLYRTQADQGSGSPADPLAALQAFTPQEIDELHALATGRDVTVAIIDTGLDVDHEDLQGAALAQRDFVDMPAAAPEVHATAVAGVLLARPDNGVGIKGLAPDAKVVVLRACWQPYASQPAYCSSSTLARALSEALALDADIVNLSITGPMDPLLALLVEQLLARNVIVVAANRDTAEQGPFPSSLPGVIAATARPLFAAYPGPVYAPGRDVISLLPGNRYGLHDGSSISAAHVSAIAGLFRQLNPDITAAQFDALLRGQGIEADGIAGLVEALTAQLP